MPLPSLWWRSGYVSERIAASVKPVICERIVVMGTETEFKFAVRATAGAEMLEGFGSRTGDPTHYETTYFDTDDFALKANEAELRLRRCNGAIVQTVKAETAAASAFTRLEHEITLSDPQLDMGHAREHLPAALKRLLAARSLKPQFRTSFDRLVHVISEPTFLAEASLDIGYVGNESRQEPILEVEFELKSGDLDDYSAACLRFLDTVPVSLLIDSKSARGYRLASGTRPQAYFSRKSSVKRDVCLADAVLQIFRHGFSQFLRNHPAVTISGHPEAIHQMRIGMRRLRAALQSFRPVLELGDGAELFARMKRLFELLGDVRLADVFLEETIPGAVAAGLGNSLETVLRREVTAYRKRAYRKVQEQLTSTSFARLVVELNRWIESRRWLKSPKPGRASWAQKPVGDFAAKRIRKLHRKLLKLGHKARTGTLDDWHRARIAAKKLRYVGGPLFSALPGKANVKKLIKRLGKLQDTLGHLNDLNSMTAFLDQVKLEVSAEDRADFSAAAQFCIGWSAGSADTILRKAETAMARFEAVALPKA